MERRTLIFSGQVQGVGFRMTAVRLGEGYALSGTVKNLGSGEVELTVAGEGEEISALAERLCEHFGARVRTVDHGPVSPSGATGIRVVH